MKRMPEDFPGHHTPGEYCELFLWSLVIPVALTFVIAGDLAELIIEKIKSRARPE